MLIKTKNSPVEELKTQRLVTFIRNHIEIIHEVLHHIPEEFDTHTFVRRWSHLYPDYWETLVDQYYSDDLVAAVEYAHYVIERALCDTSSLLGIITIGMTMSRNLVGKNAFNIRWRKLLPVDSYSLECRSSHLLCCDI